VIRLVFGLVIGLLLDVVLLLSLVRPIFGELAESAGGAEVVVVIRVAIRPRGDVASGRGSLPELLVQQILARLFLLLVLLLVLLVLLRGTGEGKGRGRGFGVRLRSRDLSYFSRLEPARFERARGRRGTDARAPPPPRGDASGWEGIVSAPCSSSSSSSCRVRRTGSPSRERSSCSSRVTHFGRRRREKVAREDLSSRGAASKDSVRGEVMRLSSRPGRDRRVELGVQTDREGYRAPVV